MYISAALCFCIAFLSLKVLLSARIRRLALDRPNERSLHEVPVPRTGGLAIVAGVSASLPFLDRHEQVPLLIAILLATVSFADDLFGLRPLLRFAAHLVCAACLLALLEPRPDPYLIAPLLLAIGWLTNLFNFMDGSDGLAGGMAVVGFGAYAIAAHLHGGQSLAIFCLAIASAAFAFLLFNFHPARIFMGDVGSVPLGFLAGALGVMGWFGGVWALWFPLFVFSPFVVDATLTLCRRLLRREKFWHAHREHYYQRLVRMGFGHRNTALVEYGLMVFCAIFALAILDASAEVQAVSLAAGAVSYLALAAWIDQRWTRYATEKIR